MLQRVRYDFWPIEIVTKEKRLEKKFINIANLLTLNMIAMIISGFVFASYFLTMPLFAKNGKFLPFAVKLPFEWTTSPIYEITYLYQVNYYLQYLQ